MRQPFLTTTRILWPAALRSLACRLGLLCTAASLCVTTDVRSTNPFIRGDLNADGVVDVADSIETLRRLFVPHADDYLCLDAADTNDDGELDISDAVRSLLYLFVGSVTIPPPGPMACGGDPTIDELGCEAFPPCFDALYVSPEGDDSGPATKDHPLATIAKARDIVRMLRAGQDAQKSTVVYLRGGLYTLAEPLQLQAKDSGKDGARVTYQAFPGEEPVLSGGEVLDTEWESFDERIFVTQVGSQRFNSLFVNGRRATRARSPNADSDDPYYRLTPIGWNGSCDPQPCSTSGLCDVAEDRIAFHFAPGEVDSSWGNLDQVEIVSMRRFEQARTVIEYVEDSDGDGVDDKVTVRGPISHCFGWEVDCRDRYYVENFFEGLDAPGEWYLDSSEGKLYYWPLPGEELDSSVVVVPKLRQLVHAGDVVHDLDPPYGVLVPGDDLAFGTADFTLSAWFLFPEPGSDEWVLSRGDPICHAGYGVAHWGPPDSLSASPALVIRDVAGNRIACVMPGIARGEWVHLAWTVDRASGRCQGFKDGVPYGANYSLKTLGDFAASGPLFVGGLNRSFVFHGALDELQIWDRVLSHAEMEQVADGLSVTAGGVLHLPFDGDFRDTTASRRLVLPGAVLPNLVAGIVGQAMAIDTSESPSETAVEQYFEFVENVVFDGLTFAHTDWGIPPTGYPGSQASYDLKSPPMVSLVVKNSAFRRCRVRLAGADAVQLFGRDLDVTGNKIQDVGARGIVLGRANGSGVEVASLAYGLVAAATRITDNCVSATGQVFHEGIPISVFVGTDNVVAHNEVFNAPYSGINIGWFDSIGPSYRALEWSSGGTLVRGNHVHDVMQELADGAGIYALGFQPDTLIERNRVHDVQRTSRHVDAHFRHWGIYIDGSGREITVRDNLVYRTTAGGIMLQTANVGNERNIVENNILVDGLDYQVFFNYAFKCSFAHNIVYVRNDAPVLFGRLVHNAIGIADYNLYFAPHLAAELAKWIGFGFDAHSIVDDPLFVNPDSDDFNLRPDSPAVLPIEAGGIGFRPFNLDDVGPRM